MGPHGSVGAHIKTGRSPMAQDHFKTPGDPNMAQKNPKMTQKSFLGSRWDYFVVCSGTSRAVPCPDLVDPCRAKYFRAVP